MSKKDYNVQPEILKTIDYKILVLTLPETDLEDLLTHFVPERGKISKSLYEDFLIANSVGNLNQFMAHIQSISNSSGELDLIKLRKEVVALIVKHNPSLDPENITINSNKVLKLKSNKESDESIPLIKNTYWGKSYYDEYGNYNPIATKDVYTNHMKKIDKKGNTVDKKDINDLLYDKVQVFWDRLKEYIMIKRYSVEDVDYLLTQRYFHNSTSFNTHIVQNCVVDVEEIYERIDGMGVNVDPNKVIRELFQLCVSVNETISYKRARDLHPDDGSNHESKTSSPTQKTPYSRSFGSKKKKKNKLSFKSVTKAELLRLGDNMKVSLVGQDDAINKLAKSIKRASVGLKDPVKPIGSFLFAGRTGCGKTLASKVLANELIKTKKNRIVIDCSEYSSDHEYAKLIGAPAGYIGHDNGGVLTNAVAEDPFSVVVFDEVEKASTKVYDLLLQILDEGRLTDGKGAAVSFKDTVIIMTSNIGVKEIDEVGKTIGFGDVAVLTENKKGKALDTALKNKFKPEFLNRIDSVVHFKDLSKEDYMRIIDIELYKLAEYLKANDTEYKTISLSFDNKLKNFIFKHGVDAKFGARPIKRAIERYVSNEIAGVLLENNHSPYAEISTTVKKGKVCFEITDIDLEQELQLGAQG